MKRKCVVCLLIGTLAMTNVLAGCGKDSETAERKETDKGGDSAVIWTNLENEAETLQEYAKKWEEETGNKVEVVHETADIQQFAQAIKSEDAQLNPSTGRSIFRMLRPIFLLTRRTSQ